MTTGPREAVPPTRKATGVVALVIGTALLVRLPLLGAWLAGYPLAVYEEPLADPGLVRHAPSSWLVFAALGALAVVVAATMLRHLRRAPIAPPPRRHAFPKWGWLALGWTAAWWLVAWVPVAGLEGLRVRSFTPLWIGYVAVVEALSVRARGHGLVTRARDGGDRPVGHPAGARSRRASAPLAFVALSLVSALFWWVFEYLNRFVESWSYHGVDLQSPLDFVWYGLFPFATVLPAVATTQHLLAESRWLAPFARWHPIRLRRPRLIAAVALFLAIAGLAALAPAASYLFPLLWLAPLAAATATLALTGHRHCLSDLARGDWRLVVSYGTAAVITGFFWEMWNYLSWPRWTYRIPFVDLVQVFEMPLLGYFGYVPFGLECATIALLVGLHPARAAADGMPRTE